MEDPKILYVMGYGRSGSTLVDILLGQNPNICNVGELSNFSVWRQAEYICSCGAKLPACPFWGEVLKRYDWPQDSTAFQGRTTWKLIQSWFAFPLLLLRLARGAVFGKAGEDTRHLYREISREANAKIVLDSSKSAGFWWAGRPLFLYRFMGLPIKFLYITRDGRSVALSAMKQPGSPERKRRITNKNIVFLKTVLSWSITQMAAMLTKVALPSRFVFVLPYERLVENPAAELKRIEEFLGIDLSDVIKRVELAEPLVPGHLIGGNRLRFQDGIRIKPTTPSLDRKLSFTQSLLYWCIAGPFAIALGYRPRRPY